MTHPLSWVSALNKSPIYNLSAGHLLLHPDVGFLQLLLAVHPHNPNGGGAVYWLYDCKDCESVIAK